MGKKLLTQKLPLTLRYPKAAARRCSSLCRPFGAIAHTGAKPKGDRVARPTPQSSEGGLPYAEGIGGGLSSRQPRGRDTGDAPRFAAPLGRWRGAQTPGRVSRQFVRIQEKRALEYPRGGARLIVPCRLLCDLRKLPVPTPRMRWAFCSDTLAIALCASHGDTPRWQTSREVCSLEDSGRREPEPESALLLMKCSCTKAIAPSDFWDRIVRRGN